MTGQVVRTKQAWTHKVVKMARGGQGEWFAYPTAGTFTDSAVAVAFAEKFADEQRAAGVVGARIVVIARNRGATIASCNVGRGDLPSERANANVSGVSE